MIFLAAFFSSSFRPEDLLRHMVYPLSAKWKSIFIASLLPCGIHYAQTMDGMKTYFTSDTEYDPPINGAGWGFFQTVFTFPNLVIPIMAGALMDNLFSPALVSFIGKEVNLIFNYLCPSGKEEE